MKLVEIRELSIDELSGQIKKSNLELVDLRMKLASRQLEDPSKIRKKRKEIARLLTVQTQKNNGKIAEKVESKESTDEVKKVKKEKALKEQQGTQTNNNPAQEKKHSPNSSFANFFKAMVDPTAVLEAAAPTITRKVV